ncbi:MAG: hypothetical protein V9G19_09980 [Tetrasphaera sp.]
MTLLATLEEYYDRASRTCTTVEEVGPFTLFIRTSEKGFHY